MEKKSVRFVCGLLVMTLALFTWSAGETYAIILSPQPLNSFIELCRTGTAQEVGLAIRAGADVNAAELWWRDGGRVGAIGGTSLIAAMSAGRVTTVTALMVAAASNPNSRVIAVLVRNGADVNAKDSLGRTALMWAAIRSPNPVVVTALLENGADAKVKDSDGKMAIDYAQYNKDIVNTNAFRKLNDLSD